MAVLLALALTLRGAYPLEPGVDYFSDASAAIDALARGDLHDYWRQGSLMGSFSLLLRAPFVALFFEQSIEVVYFAGVLPCLAAVVAVVVAVRRRMAAIGRPATAIALVTLIGVVNPGVFRAIHWGHPEELLGAALCAGSVLAAARSRTGLAGVLLGLALATKQWAFVAVVPVLLAAPARRVPLALVAAAVAATLTVPTLIAAPEAFVEVQRRAVQSGAATGPFTVWWLGSEPRPAAEYGAGESGFAYSLPSWLAAMTHPGIVLVSLPLGWLYYRRRRGALPEEALGLLALLMLLRCVLDPWNNDYYHAPFLLALLSWEALTRSGWPRATLAAGAAIALTFPAGAVTFTELSAAGDLGAVIYLTWSVPLVVWLGAELFFPGALRDLVSRRRRSGAAVAARNDANVARA